MNQNGDLRAAAEFLVQDNIMAEPELTRIYWFPAENEVRLIEVYPYAIPVREGDSVTAFHFGADIKGGFPFNSAIGLVSPEEEGKVPPPASWGDWSDAVVIWEAK